MFKFIFQLSLIFFVIGFIGVATLASIAPDNDNSAIMLFIILPIIISLFFVTIKYLLKSSKSPRKSP